MEKNMVWKEENLDFILVPTGLLILCVYHLRLLYLCKYRPETTVIGYEMHCREHWVKMMLKLDAKDRSQCKDVINSTISTATFLASMSLVLGSLMGTWVASSSENNIFKLKMIYGNSSSSIISFKYIGILGCFLLAFTCYLQSARHYVHANFLITMPICVVPEELVVKEVLRGKSYWLVGLRAIYLAITLLVWVFGPIPFLVCTLIMVVILFIIDRRKAREWHDFKVIEQVKESDPDMFKRVVKDITAIAQSIVKHHHLHHDNGHDGGSHSHKNGNQIANDQGQVGFQEYVAVSSTNTPVT